MTSSYLHELNEYKTFIDSIDAECGESRIEFQFESLKDRSLIGTIDDFSIWFEAQQSKSEMTIKDIPLSECKGWSIDNNSGWISHESGEFFVVQGVRVGFSKNREVVGGWDQPIITQIGFNGGLLGLLRKRINDVPHYLIEAKAEPGNPDKVQISPTLQATFSNLKQAHGGKKPRFSEYFETPDKMGGKILFSQWMSEDGGRLHLKRNKGMLVEINEKQELSIPENFYWASLYQLKELIKSNSWVNPHVRGIISSL
jgi:oxidase EvaA